MRLRSAETLRAKIDERSVSLGDLAKQAGCSKGFISHLTAGRRVNCRADLAAAIAKALGVSTSSLFLAGSAIGGSRPRKQRMRTGAAA